MPRAASAAVLALLPLLGIAGPAHAASQQDIAALARVERELADVQVHLGLLRDLAERGELSGLERARQRFSEGETQFLLESFDRSATLMRDAVDVPAFREDPSYPHALYYLAESLYQTRGYMESRRWFREAITRLPSGRLHQDALVRLIELSERTRDVHGIDQFYESAVRGGTLRPQVVYLYAKWIAHRQDLPLAERVTRADLEFARIQKEQAYHPQALYYRGALQVQLGRFDEAAGFFEQILNLSAPANAAASLPRVRSLAVLALARVLYEQGAALSGDESEKKLRAAIARYQQVPRDSADYDEALFETAATYVRIGDYEQALRTSDVLMVLGKDSPVAPEAQLLQGSLRLKLGRWDEAIQTFEEVVRDWAPVRDEIQKLLTRPNLVEHFDSLLSRAEGAPDLSSLLPPAARPFVDPDREVAVARSIAGEFGSGKQAIADAQATAQRILEAVEDVRLSRFAHLEEAHNRAIQLSNQLATQENALVELQVRLLGQNLPQHLRDRLDRLESERRELGAKLVQLPRTQEQFQERKAAFGKRLARLEREAFSLQKGHEAALAQLSGLRRFWRDSARSRNDSAQDDAEMESTLAQFETLVAQLGELRNAIDREIAEEKSTLARQASGGEREEELRARVRRGLTEMQAFIAEAAPHLATDNQTLLGQVARIRVGIETQQGELTALRKGLQQKAREKADEIRRQVLAEQVLLEQYAEEASRVEGGSGHLLGRVAYDSFRQVGRQFHDIVLKADVGIVDVAWTRKQLRTEEITAHSEERAAELRLLEKRFQEVRGDDD